MNRNIALRFTYVPFYNVPVYLMKNVMKIKRVKIFLDDIYIGLGVVRR